MQTLQKPDYNQLRKAHEAFLRRDFEKSLSFSVNALVTLIPQEKQKRVSFSDFISIETLDAQQKNLFQHISRLLFLREHKCSSNQVSHKKV
jgi:hypothetical protein